MESAMFEQHTAEANTFLTEARNRLKSAHKSKSTLKNEKSDTEEDLALKPTEIKNKVNKTQRSYMIQKTNKSAKEKRKLREKRRATGVVHMPCPESTGDSLDEDDCIIEKTEPAHTVPTNTQISNHHHSDLSESENGNYLSVCSQQQSFSTNSYSSPLRNKSTSDLDADFEDNQDYDSTYSFSEANLTSPNCDSPPLVKELKITSARESSRNYGTLTLTPKSQQHSTRQQNYGSKSFRGTQHTQGQRTVHGEIIPKSDKHEDDSLEDRNTQLEKIVAKLQIENMRLTNQLSEQEQGIKALKMELKGKDEQIRELTNEVRLLDQELDDLDTCNLNLVAENKALHKALTTIK